MSHAEDRPIYTAPVSLEPERSAHADGMSRTFSGEVRGVLNQVEEMLIAKNAAYGDAALNPVRIFSRADVGEQIRVRMDDKLSRLARGEAAGEDQIDDLLGYLVLLKIHEGRNK